MAKNYSFKEAVEIITAGKDFEAIADIGRRYPILVAKVAKVAALAGDSFTDIVNFIPDFVTANKVNTLIKNKLLGGADEADEAAAEDDVNEVEAEDTDKPVKPAATGKDYESMSAKELWDILGKAGLRKLAKSTKKVDLVEACKAMDAGVKPAGPAKSDKPTKTTKEEAVKEAEADAYAGKSAVELFKECKARGIKAEPKKDVNFYAELLRADDAEDTSEDEDWGEEEAVPEEKVPAKPAKPAKPAAKPATKPTKTEASEDEDWDI